jgi:Cu(I)/Ag(I) efflux system membrane fusion protein
MDLIALARTAGSGAQVSLRPDVIDLLAIETRPVVRQAIGHAISMVGSLTVDETRTSMISAWVPGRIDRLFVDSTGIYVRKDDHLADLYSPPLYQAQVELAQALSALERATTGRNGKIDESLIAAATSGVHAVKERMRLWGLGDAQISKFASLDEPTDRITIYAPSNGVITSKLVHEGRYIETGTPIYQIADLSSLWLELQAFESDLPWLFLGQRVEFNTDSHSGETFEGIITFVEPWIDSSTRTAKLRVEVPNPGGRLKPKMFVRANVIAQVGAGGAALAPDLEGSFACPMHPQIRSELEGSCPICEMPLEPLAKLAESFGLAATSQESGLPLIIPTTAPLLTGKRAVVYVQTEGEDGARLFEGREIKLGPRASGMYVVLAGLEEGELVVTRGAFKLDSELELKAQPSWMNSGVWEIEQPSSRPAWAERAVDLPALFGESWNAFWIAYLEIQEGLAGDDLEAFRAAGAKAQERLESQFGEEELAEDMQRAWSKDMISLAGSLRELRAEGLAIAQQRARFEIFNGAVYRAMKKYGAAIEGPVYVVHCPMAFDGRGADWLQADQLVNNPYYGAMMLRCGSVKETLVSDKGENK